MPIKLCAPVTQFISRSCLLLLKGKVAPVTGGVKNFGGLISRQMADAEASDKHTIILDPRRELEILSRKLREQGGKAAAFQAVMTKPVSQLSPMQCSDGAEVK